MGSGKGSRSGRGVGIAPRQLGEGRRGDALVSQVFRPLGFAVSLAPNRDKTGYFRLILVD